MSTAKEGKLTRVFQALSHNWSYLWLAYVVFFLSEGPRTITWEGNTVLSQITMAALFGNPDELS